MTSKKKLRMLIDCDSGTDDVQAIFMALSNPDVEVVAITTVHGNASVTDCYRNTLRALKVVGRLDVSELCACRLRVMMQSK